MSDNWTPEIGALVEGSTGVWELVDDSASWRMAINTGAYRDVCKPLLPDPSVTRAEARAALERYCGETAKCPLEHDGWRLYVSGEIITLVSNDDEPFGVAHYNLPVVQRDLAKLAALIQWWAQIFKGDTDEH
jgi:hypothetical protein